MDVLLPSDLHGSGPQPRPVLFLAWSLLALGACSADLQATGDGGRGDDDASSETSPDGMPDSGTGAPDAAAADSGPEEAGTSPDAGGGSGALAEQVESMPPGQWSKWGGAAWMDRGAALTPNCEQFADTNDPDETWVPCVSDASSERAVIEDFSSAIHVPERRSMLFFGNNADAGNSTAIYELKFRTGQFERVVDPYEIGRVGDPTEDEYDADGNPGGNGVPDGQEGALDSWFSYDEDGDGVTDDCPIPAQSYSESDFSLDGGGDFTEIRNGTTGEAPMNTIHNQDSWFYANGAIYLFTAIGQIGCGQQQGIPAFDSDQNDDSKPYSALYKIEVEDLSADDPKPMDQVAQPIPLPDGANPGEPFWAWAWWVNPVTGNAISIGDSSETVFDPSDDSWEMFSDGLNALQGNTVCVSNRGATGDVRPTAICKLGTWGLISLEDDPTHTSDRDMFEDDGSYRWNPDADADNPNEYTGREGRPGLRDQMNAGDLDGVDACPVYAPGRGFFSVLNNGAVLKMDPMGIQPSTNSNDIQDTTREWHVALVEEKDHTDADAPDFGRTDTWQKCAYDERTDSIVAVFNADETWVYKFGNE